MTESTSWLSAIKPVVLRSLEAAGRVSRPCALAIGNFDGVHLGHQSLLNRAVMEGDRLQLTPAALTFDPHPTTVVAPERTPQQICSLSERIQRLGEAGAQQVIVLPFTTELSRLSAEAFVRDILVRALQVKLVLVGDNFRFGNRQAGNAETLKMLGTQLGFAECLLPPVVMRGQVVSSSEIRRALLQGQMAKANRMLGHCFALSGPVVSGFGIGSTQTVPTLNVQPVPGQLTPRGVFITRTFDSKDGRDWPSITNVGSRPTFAGQQVTIETYLLGRLEEPAPREIRVEFRRFVRPERTFSDPAALRTQILHDVARAEAYWHRVTGSRTAAPSIY